MTDFVAGNRLTLIEGGRAYFPALQAACDAARREMFLESYFFDDDAAGQRTAKALIRAARRGVATHLMIDGFGSKRRNERLIAEMQQGGVRVLIYRPDITPWTLQRQRLRRMHRKLAVIDADTAFVGGINVIDDMNTPGQTPPRFDYAVQIEGPLVREILAVARRLWLLVVYSQLGGEKHMPHTAPTVPLPVRELGVQRAALLVRDNWRHRSDIEDAYLDAIGHARSEILIANAYFLPGRAFRHALTDAAARGVRVILLLQARVEYTLMRYASRALYGSFLDAGIEIYEYHLSFLHAKVAVIDRKWATVGSSNIDPFSLLLAREANVVIDDRKFAGELHASLTRAMTAGAHEVKRESWKRQPFVRRMAIWTAYGFTRLLTGVFAYGRGHDYR
jgi:cardiolipin synthase A/B